MNKKRLDIIKEFLRYAVVGGIAFVVDFGVFALFRELVFASDGSAALVVSTAAGFMAGLAVNYVLSMAVVFRSDSQQKKGKTKKAFFVFAAVGVVGLVLTELLQFLGEGIVGDGLGELGKYAVKLCVTGIVLVWNYAGRKIFVFKGE
ncbi:MAG: GtrA family protein [Ruminococcaceae bacterium]|nr:GtrA family protein [Oscillospiraceae bacterium]